ncbi:uncharacterized protein [Spinacia oleracea]|uniref:DUF4218 domain-containing protein n=1 Tax=Spinacia oleracea TaxID=3562 RepID=A0ABM3RIR0_SPIOL|nr:uncharacterized protein LOC130469975 [Spinacia oleracea]
MMSLLQIGPGFLEKCTHGLTNVATSNILDFIREVLPDASKVPNSFNEAKKLIKDLGLHSDKIDACRNDCMLYWKEHKAATSCHVCHASRWKETETINQDDISNQPSKKKWHDEERDKDELLRHPADGEAWKEFDLKYPNFAKEARNVRLGLASDGFNPFRTMSTQHSTWPVVLINYNLPPWLCMKPEFLMLSLLILGLTSPGNDIDVYLQPLVQELKDLWEYGLDTYDTEKRQTFKMHAALQSTTNDFPVYAMLSGWSTKGKFACPYCHYETDHHHLNNSNISCYFDHRRWLDENYPWRHDMKSFNGEKEERISPNPLTGTQVSSLLENWENKFGKVTTKKEISRLSMEKVLYLPHFAILERLRVSPSFGCHAHRKNICDSVMGTLLDIPRKSKDHHKARLDLQEMGIREEIHPLDTDDEGYVLLPKASFSMKKAKLPQGCASNIARCVQVKEGKILGYKSHDAHIIMQHLLPAAIRKTLPKHIALPLIRLSGFFKEICKRVINPKDLDRLQSEIVETLCELERIFPPSFFDIMVHLLIHLVDEIKHGGPVCDWWMYPIERYLGKLKSYLHAGAKKRSKWFNTSKEKTDEIDEESPLFPKAGYPLGRKKKGKKKGKSYTLDSNTMV